MGFLTAPGGTDRRQWEKKKEQRSQLKQLPPPTTHRSEFLDAHRDKYQTSSQTDGFERNQCGRKKEVPLLPYCMLHGPVVTCDTPTRREKKKGIDSAIGLSWTWQRHICFRNYRKLFSVGDDRKSHRGARLSETASSPRRFSHTRNLVCYLIVIKNEKTTTKYCKGREVIELMGHIWERWQKK